MFNLYKLIIYIFVFLFVAGPIGWAVVLIMGMMEIIDKVFPNLFKGK